MARSAAERLVDRDPDLLTVEARKDKRGDRVLVDVMRNGYGQTAVPPYAVRARRRSAGLDADRLVGAVARRSPAQVTMGSLRRRLATKDDPWAGMRRHAQGLSKARKRL